MSFVLHPWQFSVVILVGWVQREQQKIILFYQAELEAVMKAQGKKRLALTDGFALPRAVIATVMGPQLETRAEYRFLRRIGADIVGMSTAPEAITAVHAGLKCCALCVVTDVCLPDALEAVDVESIIAVANEAAPRLQRLVLGLLEHV